MTGERAAAAAALLFVVAATLAVRAHGASLASVATVAGEKGEGDRMMDGPGTSARFNFPTDVAVLPDGVILVSDRANGAIAAVCTGGGAEPGRC